MRYGARVGKKIGLELKSGGHIRLVESVNSEESQTSGNKEWGKGAQTNFRVS